MVVREIDKLMLSGLSVITNNENEKDTETAKIVQLWEDYQDKNILGATFNKSKNFDMYGVYSDYASDVNGDYKVTVAVEVTKPKNAIVIKDQRYLVFSKKGELPDIVIDCWKEIWDYFANESEYKRAYTIDFEKYSKEDEIEIYISIL
ncbi:GyrI-like domain-containing protein [Arcobacter sp. LA11]|uniref:GyrI-like domain-containing protein n=1 Tax=Arcobacter sp. LA11 TaxID=1898176 RepID=UPI0009334D34|nr:GyrI-like domain-containing protein [Arcobacter sp. LA11]